MPDFTDILKKSGETLKKGGGTNTLLAGAIPATPRRRAAVLGHDSYGVMVGYQTLRPKLFWASLAAAIGSGTMLWLRRKRGVEAWASWGAVLVVSSGAAYMTRPGGVGDPGKAQPGELDDTLAKTYRWLDQRANELDVSEPGWEERTLSKMLG